MRRPPLPLYSGYSQTGATHQSDIAPLPSPFPDREMMDEAATYDSLPPVSSRSMPGAESVGGGGVPSSNHHSPHRQARPWPFVSRNSEESTPNSTSHSDAKPFRQQDSRDFPIGGYSPEDKQPWKITSGVLAGYTAMRGPLGREPGDCIRAAVMAEVWPTLTRGISSENLSAVSSKVTDVFDTSYDSDDSRCSTILCSLPRSVLQTTPGSVSPGQLPFKHRQDDFSVVGGPASGASCVSGGSFPEDHSQRAAHSSAGPISPGTFKLWAQGVQRWTPGDEQGPFGVAEHGRGDFCFSGCGLPGVLNTPSPALRSHRSASSGAGITHRSYQEEPGAEPAHSERRWDFLEAVAQSEDELGERLTPEYEVPSSPSIIYSPPGVSPDAACRVFFNGELERMDPDIGREVREACLGPVPSFGSPGPRQADETITQEDIDDALASYSGPLFRDINSSNYKTALEATQFSLALLCQEQEYLEQHNDSQQHRLDSLRFDYSNLLEHLYPGGQGRGSHPPPRRYRHQSPEEKQHDQRRNARVLDYLARQLRDGLWELACREEAVREGQYTRLRLRGEVVRKEAHVRSLCEYFGCRTPRQVQDLFSSAEPIHSADNAVGHAGIESELPLPF